MSDSARSTPYAIFTVLASSLSGLLVGYQTAVISGALTSLSKAFSLTGNQEGIAVSAILMGALFGALFSGALADGIGRKRSIALSTLLFILGAVLSGLAPAELYFLLGRVISGLAVGIAAMVLPLYLAEIAPPRSRGAFVGAYQFAVTVGILIAYGMNYFFAPAGDWRTMFLVGVIPGLFQFSIFFFLPETPAWLLKRGKNQQALKILAKLRSRPMGEHQLEEMIESAKEKNKGSWKVLWKPGIRFPLFLGLSLSVLQQITGINAVIYYAPKIFSQAGLDINSGAVLASIAIGVVNVLATLLAMKLLDKLGRRILLIVGTIGMFVSLSVLSYAFLNTPSHLGAIATVCLMVYVASFAIGLGSVTWVLISEIYPMIARGKAMTLAIFLNWGFNYLVSLSFPYLILNLGQGATFGIYGVLCVLTFLFTIFYIKETKGKSLEEIEDYFSHRAGIIKS